MIRVVPIADYFHFFELAPQSLYSGLPRRSWILRIINNCCYPDAMALPLKPIIPLLPFEDSELDQ
jgi:hypothetical protein